MSIKKIQKANQRFIERYKLLQQKIGKEKAPKDVEQIILLWKSYMERIEKIRYTKLTSKEIILIERNKDLEEILKNCDSVIYGRIFIDTIPQNLNQLMDITNTRIALLIEQYQHNER